MKAVLFNNEIIGFIGNESLASFAVGIITAQPEGTITVQPESKVVTQTDNEVTSAEERQIAERDTILTVWARFMRVNGPTFVYLDTAPISCAKWNIGTYIIVPEGSSMKILEVVEVELRNWMYSIQKKRRHKTIGTISVCKVAEGVMLSDLNSNLNSNLNSEKKDPPNIKESFAQLTATCDELARERDDMAGEIRYWQDELNTAIGEKNLIIQKLNAALDKNLKYKNALSELMNLYNTANRQQMCE